MYAQKRVLLFGHNEALLQTRRLVLQSVGVSVDVAQDLEMAAEMILAQEVDALILCQTLSERERWEAITVAQALREPMKVLVVQDEYARLPKDKSAAVLDTIVHPMDLIAAVRRILPPEA